MTSIKRRTFLKGTLASSALSIAVGAGILKPQQVLAEWSQSGFKAKSVSAALQALYGTDNHSQSGNIKIKAPDIAENGAVVPITISTGIKNVDSIAIVVEKNPSPLAAKFDLSNSAEGFVSTRVKMGKTSPLTAVVKSGGKLFSSSKEIKVTIGGCGG